MVAIHGGNSELEAKIKSRLNSISELTESALQDRFKSAVETGELGTSRSAKQLASLTYCVLLGLSHASRIGADRKKLNAIASCFLENIASQVNSEKSC